MGDKKAKDKAAQSAAKGAQGAPMSFAGQMAFPAFAGDMERMMRRMFSDEWMSRMMPFADWPRVSGDMPFSALVNAPRAEMSESDSEYEISVELPGLDEKDIELTLSDTTLTLKGEKKAEKEGKEKDYHFTERSYGSIRRQFTLPRGIDRDGMKATFSKGVLHVTLPKSDEAKTRPRRIAVTAT